MGGLGSALPPDDAVPVGVIGTEGVPPSAVAPEAPPAVVDVALSDPGAMGLTAAGGPAVAGGLPVALGAGVEGGATLTVAVTVGAEDRGPRLSAGHWVAISRVMAVATAAVPTAAAVHCPRGVCNAFRTAPPRATIAAASPPM